MGTHDPSVPPHAQSAVAANEPHSRANPRTGTRTGTPSRPRAYGVTHDNTRHTARFSGGAINDRLEKMRAFGYDFVVSEVLRSEVEDKEAMEAIVESSGLDWTVVRVGLLHDGPSRGTWRAADDASIRSMGRISRADVATFMLDQLRDASWLRRKPALME